MERYHDCSGSDGNVQYAMVGERKKRRMISNRDSARRSRMRKQQLVESLVNQASMLRMENIQTVQKINETSSLHSEVEFENNLMRVQAAELNERLRSLNSIMELMEGDVNGFPIMEPWQELSFLAQQPIMASMDTIQW